MVDRFEVEALVKQILASGGALQCRADFPHDGKLRFIRGPLPYYNCECGKRYLKDGRGGLVDMPEVSRAS